MTNPMVKVWEWLLSKPTTGPGSSKLAGYLVLLLYLGPPFGLVVGGAQMAKHGLPIWSAVIVPLVVEVACFWFLILQPGMKAQSVVRTREFLPEAINAKVERLRAALTEAADLSRELDARLDASNASLAAIQAKSDLYKRAAATDQKSFEVSLDVIAEQLETRERRSFKRDVTLVAVSVFASAVITLLATLFAKSISL
jgi:hypothetical protein